MAALNFLTIQLVISSFPCKILVTKVSILIVLNGNFILVSVIVSRVESYDVLPTLRLDEQVHN